MTGILNLLLGVGGAVKDAYFNLVSLLLPGNGTNGANNNTFLDSSSNTFTISRNPTSGPNAPTQGTFSPFSQTGWGNYFNGSNAYINTGTSADFAFGTGDFQIEFFFFPQSSTSQRLVFFSVTDQNQITCDTNYNTVYYDGTNLRTIGTANANAWNHVVVAKSSGTVSCWLNGSRTVNALTDSSNTTSNRGVFLGANNTGTERLTGYMSNVSIVKGAPTYSGATITVPTAPLSPSKTNQVLLVFQANRFIDSNTATTAKTLTINGTPQITPFSPFAPTQSYSASAVGGSGYFDGTGDYLQTPSNTAFAFGGDWTIEFWYYPLTAYTDGRGLFGFSDDKDNVDLVSTNALRYFNGTTSTTFTGVTYTVNAWNHLAFVNSGGTVRLYINGAQSTNSHSGVTTSSARSMFILSNILGTTSTNSYASNLRIIKGTAVYTGAFTPPTKPVATSGADSAGSYPSTTNVNTSFASSACSLLLNFTNAGVVDATAKNVLETVGNAQISTTPSKWGGGSIRFDGTSNTSCMIAQGRWQPFFGANFSIEMWFRVDSLSGVQTLISQDWRRGIDGPKFALFIGEASSDRLTYFANSGAISIIAGAGNAISANTWYFVQVIKTGGNVYLYLNGNLVGSAADTYTYPVSTYATYIGRSDPGGSVQGYLTGYIDDLRVTIGQARTAGTATAPFPLQ